MTFARKIRLIIACVGFVWVPLLLIGLTGSLNFAGWIVVVASFLVHASAVVAVVGAPVQVLRDGGTPRAALAVFLTLYAPGFVRRLSKVDEEERTPGVPALGPIRTRAAWSDGQGGFWADVEIIRDSDVERWRDMRGEIFRALGLRLRAKNGEHLRIEAGTTGLMRWSYFSRDPLAGVRTANPEPGLKVKFGRCEDGTDAVWDFAEATHYAVQGMTRSGKSAFLYVLLAGLSRSDSARIWGIDPNRVLLSPVAAVSEPDRFVLGNDPEAAGELLERFAEHMDQRMSLLDAVRQDKFESFDEQLPVDILVLEEWPSLVRAAATLDRKLKTRIESLFGRIVSEGAKVGIRVILIAQRMSAELVPGDSRGQFGGRFTLAVDNREAISMLNPNVDADLVDQVREFRPGRALMWLHRREQIVQTDLMTYSQYRAALGADRVSLP